MGADGVIPLIQTYHGVLAHQDDTLTTEGVSDLVHLLGRDIVNLDDEGGLVLLEQALELVEIAGLVLAAPHIFLFMKVGCLRATVYCMVGRGVYEVADDAK